MRYRDSRGVEWDGAEQALLDFIQELPVLTEEETEQVFQFTQRDAGDEFNLRAIAVGILYSGLWDKFEGDNYPVPEPIIEERPEVGTEERLVRR